MNRKWGSGAGGQGPGKARNGREGGETGKWVSGEMGKRNSNSFTDGNKMMELGAGLSVKHTCTSFSVF